MLQEFIRRMTQYAESEPCIEAVVLVGSCARGANRPDSDVDVCILSTVKAQFVESPAFVPLFGKVVKQQTEEYGACTSVRAWYDTGLEVEFGLVEPSWAAQPLDAGTRRVLSGGYKVLVDKKNYFSDIDAVLAQ